jgi:(p)ppGpp synthase/HD superfamily hydrolase
MLTSRFEEALAYAARLHAGQVRTGTSIPYISHLLAVAAIVLEDGGDEDEAIAALLHDAVEDQGGPEMLEEISRRFGQRVARIVAGCTDAQARPKPPWRDRKEAHLRQLEHADPSVLRVVAADKLHNARSIAADYRRLGEGLWERFSGGREGTLWYLTSMAELLQRRQAGALAEALAREVRQLQQLVQASPPDAGSCRLAAS